MEISKEQFENAKQVTQELKKYSHDFIVWKHEFVEADGECKVYFDPYSTTLTPSRMDTQSEGYELEILNDPEGLAFQVALDYGNSYDHLPIDDSKIDVAKPNPPAYHTKFMDEK